MIRFSQHLFRSLLPGLLLALFGSGLLVHILMTRNLTQEFDRGLTSLADSLIAITEQDEAGVELEEYHVLPGYSDQNDPDYFEIYSETGKQLFHSTSLGSEQLLFKNWGSGDQIVDVLLPNGRAGRLIKQSFYPKIEIANNTVASNTESVGYIQARTDSDAPGIVPEQVTVLVAISREVLDDNITQLKLILLLTGLLTVSVVVFLHGSAIRRSVRPIEEISQQINALDAEKIDNPLVLSHPILELQILTDQFNGLMQRLHDSFQRERRFSSDLAHEMRTPLAELRTLVEVSQRWPKDPTIHASFSKDVNGSVSRIEGLTRSLLALSRGESGALDNSGCVDLVKLIPRIVSQYETGNGSIRHHITVTLPDQTVKVNGQEQWPQILDNLIDNATEHSPAGSTINISLAVNKGDDSFEFMIENYAPDIEEKDLTHLFDRLWRKDAARSSVRHCGLGLSLVKMYVALIGGNLSVSMASQKRLQFLITGESINSGETPLFVG